MTGAQESKIEINAYEGAQVNIATNKSHIEAQQNNSGGTKKDLSDKINDNSYSMKKKERILIAVIVAAIIVVVLCGLIFELPAPDLSQTVVQPTNDGQTESENDSLRQDGEIPDDHAIYNSSLFLKAKALQIEGKHLDAAVIYNELFGSFPNAEDYQLENIRFWEAYAYFCQFLVSGGVDDKYRYKAIEIFKDIADTKKEENEDIKLMSMGCYLLICNDSSDADYEGKTADYCKYLEEAMVNNKNLNMEDYNTYNTLTISYWSLAVYYQQQYARGNSPEHLAKAISYYQEALKNCRGMIKCGHGVFDSKNAEIVFLKNLARYNAIAYVIIKDERYLLDAESYFDEIKNKVDINTDLSMYVDCMKNVAIGKIIIGDGENVKEGYEILYSLFYYICKEEDELHDIGYWMIFSGLATDSDRENIKECYDRIIGVLEKEDKLQEYVDVVYEAAECYWFWSIIYQDKDAFDEGYGYIMHLQNVYLDLVDSYFEKKIENLIKKYNTTTIYRID